MYVHPSELVFVYILLPFKGHFVAKKNKTDPCLLSFSGTKCFKTTFILSPTLPGNWCKILPF